MASSSPPPPDADADAAVADMRCIAHLDMDCFYAQVEAVRLGVDCRTTPLVLSQWDFLIAVNYPARAYGIKRGLHNVHDARRLCPDVIVALSPSYRVGEAVSQYHPHPTRDHYKISLEPYREASRKIFSILRAEPGVQVEKGSVDEAYMDVTVAAQRELAQLRAASTAAAAPLDALHDVLEPSTRLIEDRRGAMEAWYAERGTSLEAVFDAPMRALLRGTCGAGVRGSRGFCVSRDDTAYEERCLLLCAASRVVWRLRQRLYAELHYDCSAGIAHNRVLAKCISATHKPNQQTLLLPDRSASALFDLPLKELRGFGGKFGAAVRAVCGGATECRELWMAPLPQLYALDGTAFATAAEADDDGDDGGDGGGDSGDDEEDDAPARRTKKNKAELSAVAADGSASSPSVAEYTFFRMRGVHGDAVADPALPRSMEASKIFHPSCTSWVAARLWMAPLAGELWHRFRHYEDHYGKEGRNLVVYFRTYVSADEARRGHRPQSFRRHGPLPNHIEGAAVLAEVGLRELEKLMGEVTHTTIRPCGIDFRAGRVAPADDLRAAGKEEEQKVLMPPLRIIGLSIIGLHPCAVVGGGAGAASTQPQRSLTEMFANLAATRGDASASSSSAPPPPALSVQHARCPSSVASAAAADANTDALPVVEVGSDDEEVESVSKVGSQQRPRTSTRRASASPTHSAPQPPPTTAAPPPPTRRTLSDFFHAPPPRRDTVAAAEPQKVFSSHLWRQRSTSVIEVSSDDEDETIE